MEIVIESLADVPLLRVKGEIDHFTSGSLEDAVRKAFLSDGAPLLIELSECAYLDSGGLAIILKIVRGMQGDRWLGLVGCRPEILRLLDMFGLPMHAALRLFANQDEALAALEPTNGR